MIKYINLKNFKAGLKNFKQKKPFPYAVIDNFFKKDVAKYLKVDRRTLRNYCKMYPELALVIQQY